MSFIKDISLTNLLLFFCTFSICTHKCYEWWLSTYDFDSKWKFGDPVSTRVNSSMRSLAQFFAKFVTLCKDPQNFLLDINIVLVDHTQIGVFAHALSKNVWNRQGYQVGWLSPRVCCHEAIDDRVFLSTGRSTAPADHRLLLLLWSLI